MPTLSAPSNSQEFSDKTAERPMPPTPLSSSQTPKSRESIVAAVLFIISLFLLCGLIGVFIVKSANTYRIDSPVLAELPKTTNKNTLLIEGSGPKKSVIEISSDSTSYFADTDKNGFFSINVETRNDGKLTYHAIARKKILFIKFESEQSNEVTTSVDKTSPSLKIVSLPKILTSSNYTLKGTSSEPVKINVKVNNTDYSIDTDSKNSFSFPLKLKKGGNTVILTATDPAGNETSTASLTTTYATGTVYVSTKSGTKQLPNSAGDLSSALSTAFGKMIAISAVVIGILGFMASSGAISLYKMAKGEA